MKPKFGLIPKLILAIFLGILTGEYLPDYIIRIAVTFSKIFGGFLSFIIPLMIIAFVAKGIADLTKGAGKLLFITVAIAYASTLIGGSLSYFMSRSIFPNFVSADLAKAISDSFESELQPIFSVEIKPFFDVTGALIFAFMMGLSIAWLKNQGKGDYTYNLISEFNEIIVNVLKRAVIPFLPFMIYGNFANMAYSGAALSILNIFWKIFICVIALHLIYVSLMFIAAGAYTKKNPFKMMKNEIKGYMTAVGTQSSAATIPVNIECAKANGVSKEIREFVVPLGATVHMPGSMITLTACTFTILLMNNMPHSFGLMFNFIAVLGIAMVAAPGAPGGAVMSALPFIPIIGIPSEGVLASLLISLYLAQDSFGTAANIAGDNAIAAVVDKYYQEHIKNQKTAVKNA